MPSYPVPRSSAQAARAISLVLLRLAEEAGEAGLHDLLAAIELAILLAREAARERLH